MGIQHCSMTSFLGRMFRINSSRLFSYLIYDNIIIILSQNFSGEAKDPLN